MIILWSGQECLLTLQRDLNHCQWILKESLPLPIASFTVMGEGRALWMWLEVLRQLCCSCCVGQGKRLQLPMGWAGTSQEPVRWSVQSLRKPSPGLWARLEGGPYTATASPVPSSYCHMAPLHGAMLTPAPGLCWVFILLITTNEMGRASPQRRKGRTGVRSWGCLELPCFCLLYYLGKSPVSCLILKRVWLDEYFPKRSKNTGLSVFFSFQNALKTWVSWYFSGKKKQTRNLDDVAYMLQLPFRDSCTQ